MISTALEAGSGNTGYGKDMEVSGVWKVMCQCVGV